MHYELVVVGASLGGLVAIEVLLSGLPAGFAPPLAAVLHRSAQSGASLRAAIQRHTSLRVVEPQDKEPIEAGCVYLAPADYHLLVEDHHFALSMEGPVRHSRPSIDVLFESAAETFADRLLAIVLTGASDDGARGVSHVKQRGGFVVVQDPATAECAVMPQAALDTGTADRVLPLSDIAPFLLQLTTAAGGSGDAI